MKKRLLALLLVLAMAFSLAACGKNNDTGDDGAGPGDQQTVDDSQTGGEGQEGTDGGIPAPDGGAQVPSGEWAGGPESDDAPSDGGQNQASPDGGDGPGIQMPPSISSIPGFPVPDGGNGGTEIVRGESAGVSVIQRSVTLFYLGQTIQLSMEGVTEQDTVTYSSADESVATVDGDGAVTAKSAGDTELAIHIETETDVYDFTCAVHCQDDGTPAISAFFDGLKDSYEAVASLSAVEGEVLESGYPGLASAEGVEEVLVMEPAVSFSAVAVALVKLSDGASAAQIQTVEDILQTRLDSQASGGAYYLSAQETWGQGVVVSCGVFVGMFVCDGHAQDFADYFTSTYGG